MTQAPRFNSVVALLAYQDIAAAHDFLVDAFGFESVGVERDSSGIATHGEVRIGTMSLWLHRVAPAQGLASPVTRGAASSGLVVMVDDVDAHYRRAREAGAEIVNAIKDRPYGQREYGARDPEGHRWWFATPIDITSGT